MNKEVPAWQIEQEWENDKDSSLPGQNLPPQLLYTFIDKSCACCDSYPCVHNSTPTITCHNIEYYFVVALRTVSKFSEFPFYCRTLSVLPDSRNIGIINNNYILNLVGRLVPLVRFRQSCYSFQVIRGFHPRLFSWFIYLSILCC